jgi:hypothetical protein
VVFQQLYAGTVEQHRVLALYVMAAVNFVTFLLSFAIAA